MTFTIRPAAVEDSPAILALTKDGIAQWGADVLPLLAPWMDEVCNLLYVQNRIQDDGYQVFVAENSTGIIGSVYLKSAKDNAYFGGLYCSVKRQGVGTALLQHVLQEARAAKVDTLECEVYEENTASILLMEKLGGQQTSSFYYDDVPYLVYTFDIDT